MKTRIIILMKEAKHSASVKSLISAQVENTPIAVLKNTKHLFEIALTPKDILVLSDELAEDSWVSTMPVARKIGGFILISFQKGEEAVTQDIANKYNAFAFFKAPFKSEDLMAAVHALVLKLNNATPKNDNPVVKELTAYHDEMDSYNYYELFSLSKKAGASDIKRSYVVLARKFHPDKFRMSSEDSQATAYKITKRINEAYSVLNHPNRRVVYDKQLHDDATKKRFNFHVKVSYEANPEDTIMNQNVRKMVTLAQEAIGLKEYKQAITQLKMAKSIEKGNTYIEELLKEVQEKYDSTLHVVD